MIIASKKQKLRCPYCGKHFNPDFVLIATGWCPECHNPLFQRKTLQGLSFTRNFRSEDAFIFLYFVLIFILLFFGGMKWLIAHMNHSLFLSFGIFFIAEGILFMLMPLTTRLFRLIRFKNVCPVCGGLRDKLALKLTGNCSCCGSPVNDWSAPPENDPVKDLPSFAEVIKWKKYKLWNCFFPKTLKILYRCPYCIRDDKKPWRKRSYSWRRQDYTIAALKYERCLDCRRKLFR